MPATIKAPQGKRPRLPNPAPEPPPAGDRPLEELRIPLIPLAHIVPSRDNPRIIRDDEALKSLCVSIKASGVLQPVLVRPHPTKAGHYELLAGDRRYRAAMMAELTAIPCRVMDLDDAEAMSITVIENLEREDLNPLEEARGIQTLLEKGWDEESIASRLGKSAKWVSRRARLTRLLEPYKQWALDPGHELSQAPTGLLEHLARLPEDIQQQIHAECRRIRPYLPWFMRDVSSFDAHVNTNYLRVLDRAPFKRDDVLLYPEAGACERCMKRSGRHPLLFDEEEDEKGKVPGERCLDRACFFEKSKRALKARIQEVAQEQGNPPLLIDAAASHYTGPSKEVAKAFGNTVQTLDRFEQCKKTDPKACAALIVNGPGLGTQKYLKPRPSHGSGSRSRSASAPKPEKKVRPLKELRAELEARRKAWMVDAFREFLHRLAAPGPESTGPKVKIRTKKPASTWECMSLLVAFGTATRRDCVHEHTQPSSWQIFRKHFADQVLLEVLRDQLYAEVFHNWENRLSRAGLLSNIDSYYTDMVEMAKVIGYELDELRTKAEEAIREPASWKNLNADGTPKTLKKTNRK